MARAKYLLLFFLLLCICVVKPLAADEQADIGVSLEAEGAFLKGDRVTLALELEKLHTSLEAEKLSEAAVALDRILANAQALELHSFEPLSLFLLGKAEGYLAAGKSAAAVFLSKQAFALSPFSLAVYLRGFRVAHLSRAFPASELLLKFPEIIRHDPSALFYFVTWSSYPILWALTFSLLVIMMLAIAYYMYSFSRGLNRYLPGLFRGILNPFLALALLIAPLFLGPLWTLAVWSFLLLTVIPEGKWLGFYGAALIGAWAAIIPLRENAAIHFSDPGFTNVLRVNGGIRSLDDVEVLKAFVTKHAKHPVGHFSYGRALFEEGELEAAKKQFSEAELLFRVSEDPQGMFYTKAYIAAIEYLQGNHTHADTLFTALATEQPSNAALIFNHSKVKFALLDTQTSRKMYEQAQKLDSSLAIELERRERIFGDASVRSVLPFTLPLGIIAGSLKVPVIGLIETHQQVSRSLMPPLRPHEMALLSLGLILVFLVFRPSEDLQKREALLGVSFKISSMRLLMNLVPGGAWLKRGYPGVAVLLLMLCILCAFPIIGWPRETGGIGELVSEVSSYLLAILGLFVLLVLYVGWQLSEGND